MTASDPRPVAGLGTSMHPAADIDCWRAAGWWGERDLAAFCDDAFRRHAERIALVGITARERADSRTRAAAVVRRYSYAELRELSCRGAGELAAAGVSAGDAVILHLPNTCDFVIGLASLLRLGAIPVCALHSHREPAIARMAASARAQWVLSAPERHPLDQGELSRLAEASGQCVPRIVELDLETLSGSPEPTPPLPGAEPGAVGVVQLSGGTTGASKLIPRTHAGYIYASRIQAEISGLAAGSALLVALPAAHNFPMTSPGILGAWSAGATVVMCHDPSPGTAFRMIAEHRVTHLSLVPPLAQAWIDAAQRRSVDTDSVEVVGIGGARLPESVARQVEPVLGGTLQQIYGMAEGLANFTRLDDPPEVRMSTQGRPVCPGDEIRIVDDNGLEVPPGEDGELQTRGPYTITRYLGTSAREAASFTTDGYYRTGDLVRRRADGNLQVTGRVGDQINRAGETLSAAVVEDEALAHPDIAEALAVGIPDAKLGEALALAVIPRQSGAALPDLRRHLRQQGVAEHMLPDVVVALDDVPTTAVGKNSRHDVRTAVADIVRARAGRADHAADDAVRLH